MQIEILKNLPNILFTTYSPIWLVVWFTSIYQIINITIKIDDLISKKLNNRQYIKTSLNSILIFFKKLSSALQKSLQLPDDIEPWSKKIPTPVKKFGIYIESSIWFIASLTTTTYFILISLLTILTKKLLTIPDFLTIFGISAILVVCSRFLYVEGRRCLLKAKNYNKINI
ncbi:hypothetical protein L2Z48_02460 [Acinetobacter baumannii]|uniref:hypothetical protein n=1 Tax=Acinetobacter baumannii TaxID=470 RepID=UPI001F09B27F|nr:hypothetical protein [Acinetobacter baumannii]UMN06293.1 hypothetical protein L2Z48_02460 [Acinetobacter baumannii]